MLSLTILLFTSFSKADCNPWVDSATCNSKAVYKNKDPSNGFSWSKYGDLLHPRSRHFSIVLRKNQQDRAIAYHIAGYGKCKL